MSIEAMKQALEVLNVCEQSDYGRRWVWPETAHQTAMGNVREAIKALRQAIAEVECDAEVYSVWVEPVHASDMSQERVDETAKSKHEWVGLTDEEIKEIVGPWGPTPIKGYTRKLFDQIEAKLKEKNT